MTKPKLRVLHVLAELKPSGAETMLVAAADLFREGGVEAEVLSTGAQTGSYAQRFVEAGYRLHHIPFKRSLLFFWKVRQLMYSGQYDVIHLHCETASFWYGLIALSVSPNVVVQTIHNAFAFTGNLQWRRGWQRRLKHQFGIRHVAISASVSDTEMRHYRLPTTLVWNWYDSSRFIATTLEMRQQARQAYGLGDDDFVIVSVGNCSEIKNHSTVIEAMARLPAKKRPFYLHVGIEEDGMPERQLAEKLGVADRIWFLGPQQDVKPMLQAADAYVMPSLFEGFGIAAIEALATGLPALFSDVAGLKDFRQDFPGLVYTSPGAQFVARGLRQLMQISVQQRVDIRSKYPKIAQRLFGMERGVNEYLAIYREHHRADTGVTPNMSRAAR